MGKPGNYQVSGGDKYGELPGHIVIPVKLTAPHIQAAGSAIGFIAHNGIAAIGIEFDPGVGIILYELKHVCFCPVPLGTIAG